MELLAVSWTHLVLIISDQEFKGRPVRSTASFLSDFLRSGPGKKCMKYGLQPKSGFSDVVNGERGIGELRMIAGCD